MKSEPPRVLIGTCGWDKPPGRESSTVAACRRPNVCASPRPTSRASRSTPPFHGHRTPKDFLSWRDETPDGFVFSVKVAQSITHDQELQNPLPELASFFAAGHPLETGADLRDQE